MVMRLLLFLSLLLSVTGCGPSRLRKKDTPHYAVARVTTPILSTYDFKSVFGGKDGKTLSLDFEDQIIEVALVAFPGTVFKVKEGYKIDGNIVYRVSYDELPLPETWPVYVDKRFVEPTYIPPKPRNRTLPSKDEIIENLLAAEGRIYVWGGSYQKGIPQLLDFYPPTASLSPLMEEKWSLKGVDCSGLLYEATNGNTPRNTSLLLRHGRAVKIEGLDIDQIVAKVEPLDIIVWRGHICVILDKERTIQSRLDYDKEKEGFQGGVRIQKLRDILKKFIAERVPVNDYESAPQDNKSKFVIRRWLFEEGEDINLGKWNKEKLDKFLEKAFSLKDYGEHLKTLSAEFLNTSYEEKNLIGSETGQEVLVINPAEFNKLTFLENIEAMRRSASFSEFKKNLSKIRYRDGKVEYNKRNHFFTEWRDNNSEYIEDITLKLAKDKAIKVTRRLKVPKRTPFFIPGLFPRTLDITYIPTQSIDDAIMARLKTGDYVGIYSDDKKQDVSAAGIVIRENDKVYLRHASKEKQKVVEEELGKLLLAHKGLIILRPKTKKQNQKITMRANKI